MKIELRPLAESRVYQGILPGDYVVLSANGECEISPRQSLPEPDPNHHYCKQHERPASRRRDQRAPHVPFDPLDPPSCRGDGSSRNQMYEKTNHIRPRGEARSELIPVKYEPLHTGEPQDRQSGESRPAEIPLTFVEPRLRYPHQQCHAAPHACEHDGAPEDYTSNACQRLARDNGSYVSGWHWVYGIPKQVRSAFEDLIGCDRQERQRNPRLAACPPTQRQKYDAGDHRRDHTSSHYCSVFPSRGVRRCGSLSPPHSIKLELNTREASSDHNRRQSMPDELVNRYSEEQTKVSVGKHQKRGEQVLNNGPFGR